jgi:hypothetical protein
MKTRQSMYVIKNINEKRDCHYIYDGQKKPSTPFWLSGDYVYDTSGSTTTNIYKSHFYTEHATALKQCDKLNKKFCKGGTFFFHGKLQRYRYPDSVGAAKYSHYAPTFQVVEVNVTIEEAA